MNPNWYLKTSDATQAHWWDGEKYTLNTSPLTGYAFTVFPDPAVAPSAPVAPQKDDNATPHNDAPVAPVMSEPTATVPLTNTATVPPIPTPGQSAYGVGAQAPTPNNGKKIALIVGGAILVVLIILVVAIVGFFNLVRGSIDNGAPVPDPIYTSEPSEPSDPETFDPIPSDPETTTPGDSGNTGEAGAQAEADFVTLVHDNVTTFANADSTTIIDAGYSVCSILDSGESIDYVVDIFMKSGLAPYDTGAFIGISVAKLCPTHQGQVEEYIANN